MTPRVPLQARRGKLAPRVIRSLLLTSFTVAFAAATCLAAAPAAFAASPLPTSQPNPTPSPTVTPTPTPQPTTRTFNGYDPRGVRWQDPDYRACTAASTLMMLNFTAYRHAGGAAFRWHRTTAYSTQGAILAYARRNMTMSRATSSGTDPHGWRNALNRFGWGSVTAGVYADRAYPTFASAATAAVQAMARTHKPVGIAGWAGRHAQIIHGYRVYGQDPAVSTKFKVLGVYITDPLAADHTRNTYVSVSTWQHGNPRIRFQRYLERDSIFRDPIDGRFGRQEWYGKWVLIVPTR